MNHRTLPRHPRTGVRAVGFWRGDRPIWPILGAAEDDDQGDDKPDDDKPDDDAGDDKPDEDDKELGPAGEKALQAEKAKRRQAQASLREFRDLGLSPADLKKLVDAGKKPRTGGNGDEDVDVDQIRKDARAEAATELLRERVMDKIEAKAGRLFQDPDDAAALVMRGRSADDFLDDGKVDVEEIEAALKELLEKKPYLAAAAQRGNRFQGGADGGARKESRPAQLTRDDLKRMSAQDIEKARKAGRLNDVLGIKP